MIFFLLSLFPFLFFLLYLLTFLLMRFSYEGGFYDDGLDWIGLDWVDWLVSTYLNEGLAFALLSCFIFFSSVILWSFPSLFSGRVLSCHVMSMSMSMPGSLFHYTRFGLYVVWTEWMMNGSWIE